MQNPKQEIEHVFGLLTQAHTATVQAEALNRFYTYDAAFRHPLCTVPSAPGSRKEILGIYRWYRIMSPTIQGDVETIAYDEENSIIYLEVVQKFHIWLSPLPVHPARLIVRLRLRKDGDLWYVCEQEDFYHPEDLLALVLPPLIWPARLALRIGAISSNVLAEASRAAFGWWR
ncbi:hypothetical protein K488DRAFT_78010 [Vararia minispora EC-137]|uniref:Uncharacterized protein n=1 Tax=Vararia minispora EC-137 TaxID=1314806 RepID=A0ACB8QN81_9AGAM|nr:hypothetical protein K488DRAFT_78010 [Vararia minispora EC-137]